MAISQVFKSSEFLKDVGGYLQFWDLKIFEISERKVQIIAMMG